jgi:cysteinyl-tRNA synthetase
MIKDVLERYSPEVIRMFLLSNHYRSPIDFSEDSMREVSMGLDRIYAFLERLETAGVKQDPKQQGELWNDFILAMNDDFNSARALGLVFDAVKQGNKLLDHAGPSPDQGELNSLSLFYNDIKSISRILGIFLLDPIAYFKDKRERGVADTAVDPDEIEDLIRQRAEARKHRDFLKSDEIRDLLQSRNIILEDGPTGTTWRFDG